jgi:carboxyl-terminal processing protease
MPRRLLATVLAALVSLAVPAAAAPAPGRGAPAVSLGALDVIALEIAYTTVMARYYQPVDPAVLLNGARGGIVAYLRGRGIANPALPLPPARVDRYRAENDINRDVALAIARYGTRIRTADLVRSTIAGELAALHDPYSVLFEPAAYKKFVGFLDGKPVGGIGAELDVDPQTHAVRVVDVFPGSPAEQAGILPGDTIVSIDGKPPGAAPDAVLAALRGTPASTVRIGIVRDGAEREPVAIVRRAISPPDVTGHLLRGGVAYVRLRSFGAGSAKQLDALLPKLRDAGARAYVLDLRANGGGYRDDAIAVASHFVRGTVVTTQERAGAPSVFASKRDAAVIGAPLAVLVDGDSASASEIVAGAIQDAKAGTLVGTRTFGKGLVQETFPLPDGGAIKLTTARYRTPAGRDIDKVGIIPDVVVAQSGDSHPGQPGRDPQLDRALEVLAASGSPAPSATPSPAASTGARVRAARAAAAPRAARPATRRAWARRAAWSARRAGAGARRSPSRRAAR